MAITTAIGLDSASTRMEKERSDLRTSRSIDRRGWPHRERPVALRALVSAPGQLRRVFLPFGRGPRTALDAAEPLPERSKERRQWARSVPGTNGRRNGILRVFLCKPVISKRKTCFCASERDLSCAIGRPTGAVEQKMPGRLARERNETSEARTAHSEHPCAIRFPWLPSLDKFGFMRLICLGVCVSAAHLIAAHFPVCRRYVHHFSALS
jgi:hypothetical protein